MEGGTPNSSPHMRFIETADRYCGGHFLYVFGFTLWALFPLGGLLFGVTIGIYPLVYLAGVLILVGFEAGKWMKAAKQGLLDETYRGLELQAAMEELFKIKDEAEQTKNLVEKAGTIARLGFWHFDLQTREFSSSEQLLSLLGLPLDSHIISQEGYLNLIHPDDRPDVIEKLKQAEEKGVAGELHYRIRTKDSNYLHIDSVVELEVLGDGSTGKMFGVVQDVSERVRNDELIQEQRMQLMASAKLSSLGQMAGGIAHEINTPLGAILMNAELIQKLNSAQPNPNPQIAKRTEAVVAICDKIKKIILGLKQLTKKSSDEEVRPVTLQSIIGDTLELCSEKFKNSGIDLQVAADYSNIEVSANPVQISQILLNLLNNSYDAISGSESPWIRIEANIFPSQIEFSVTDSGKGIPDKVLENIFHPFFTTKDFGKGMGLGLSISKGIMNQHKGDLLYDRLSPNTKFTMVFPTGTSEKAAA